MKKNNFIVTIFIFFVSLNSFAGGAVGNGGEVLVCKNGKVRMLDYAGIDSDVNIYDNDIDNMRDLLFKILDPLKHFDLKMYSDILNTALKISKDIEILKKNDFNIIKTNKKSQRVAFIDYRLSSTEDTGSWDELSFRNCDKIQIAQHIVFLLDHKPFVIDSILLAQLNNANELGLILHEAIYFYAALSRQHSNSENVRLLNKYLFLNYLNGESSLDELSHILVNYNFSSN